MADLFYAINFAMGFFLVFSAFYNFCEVIEDRDAPFEVVIAYMFLFTFVCLIGIMGIRIGIIHFFGA